MLSEVVILVTEQSLDVVSTSTVAFLYFEGFVCFIIYCISRVHGQLSLMHLASLGLTDLISYKVLVSFNRHIFRKRCSD